MSSRKPSLPAVTAALAHIDGFCLVARIVSAVSVNVDGHRDGWASRLAAAVAAVEAAGWTVDYVEDVPGAFLVWP